MNIALAVLTIAFFIINIVEYHTEKTIFTPINILLGPYVIITILNNLIATKQGYFIVEDKVIYLLLVALIMVYFSSFLREHININDYSNNDNVPISTLCNDEFLMKKIEILFLACSVIRLVQIIITIRQYGIRVIGQNDFSDLGFNGFPSHLYLMVFPFAALLLYRGISDKNIRDLALFSFGLLITFLSFIKYHAIFYVLISFIFCGLSDKKMIKRIIGLIALLIIILFIGNYYISFVLRGMNGYSNKDYFIKLWDYIGGSLINGNKCIRFNEYQIDYSWWDLLYASLFPVAVGILNALGANIKMPEFKLGFQNISRMGTKSNVTGLLFNISYTGSEILFVLFNIISAFIIAGIIKKIENGQHQRNLLFYSVCLTVATMTFFANYFTLTVIWELLFWSYFIPRILFSKKIVIRY